MNKLTFSDVLKQLLALHKKKSADYGSDTDVFSNVRACESFGIEAWKGVVIRLNDKMERIKQFIRKNKLVNESIEDSFLDMASYAVIAYILYKERKEIK